VGTISIAFMGKGRFRIQFVEHICLQQVKVLSCEAFHSASGGGKISFPINSA
jgi:hypothetical protein